MFNNAEKITFDIVINKNSRLKHLHVPANISLSDAYILGNKVASKKSNILGYVVRLNVPQKRYRKRKINNDSMNTLFNIHKSFMNKIIN